jgi:hypothetical protein
METEMKGFAVTMVLLDLVAIGLVISFLAGGFSPTPEASSTFDASDLNVSSGPFAFGPAGELYAADVIPVHQVGPNTYTLEGHDFPESTTIGKANLTTPDIGMVTIQNSLGKTIALYFPDDKTSAIPIVICDREVRLTLIREWGKSGEVCEVWGHRWLEWNTGILQARYRRCSICETEERWVPEE